MPKYHEYWKPKLKKLKELFDAGQTNASIDIADIREVGERQDENYPGYANVRFGTVATNTKAQHIKDLCELITKTYIIRPYSSNELKLRITTEFQLTASYTTYTNADLVKVYKGLIANGNSDEIYKWHTLNKQHWDLDATDFDAMYRAIPFHNLIYHDARRVMLHIIPLYTEEVRACLKALFDESKDLYTRIITFRSSIEAIYRRVEPKLGTHHDERTIATYLTYRFPEKYAFYKDEFYTRYCKMLGIAPAAVNKKYVHYLELVKGFKNEFVDNDKELLTLVESFKDDKCFSDENHLLLTQDILYQTLVGKWGNDEEDATAADQSIIETIKTNYMPLNTILYGPPGTGKTFNSINKAIDIVNPAFDLKGSTRSQIKDEYKRLVDAGFIEFCTFHQSLSYEDFIEGIKPYIPDIGNKDETDEDVKNTQLRYVIEDGIFKLMANRARFKPTKEIVGFSIPESEYEKAHFYKMSLGSTQNPDDEEIYRYCIDNGYVALGWGDDIDYTGKTESEVWQAIRDNELSEFDGRAINYFMHYMKTDNYVIISNGNYFFRAIGKVTGEYKYQENSGIRYNHFRKVEWLLKDVNIPVDQLYEKSFSQQSIYKLDKSAIKKDFFVKAASQAKLAATNKPSNYVLIIDEINRGNVSQIFGELITLIEEDKREGKTEVLSLILPYSKKKFSVPNNLYIIGTMNTADRSVEALDTALRRRFSFEEMTPDSRLLIKNDGTDKMVSGISLKALLDAINERIAYLLDDDHRIGHSYFYDIAEGDVSGLLAAFSDKIVPLLKEYFYNDYEKILLVLGSGFVTEQKKKPVFAGKKQSDIDRAVFVVNNITDKDIFINALKITLNAQ